VVSSAELCYAVPPGPAALMVPLPVVDVAALCFASDDDPAPAPAAPTTPLASAPAAAPAAAPAEGGGLAGRRGPRLAARELTAPWLRAPIAGGAAAGGGAGGGAGRGTCGGDYCDGLLPEEVAAAAVDLRALTLPAATAGRGAATRAVARELIVEDRRRRGAKAAAAAAAEVEGGGRRWGDGKAAGLGMVAVGSSRGWVRVDTGEVQVWRGVRSVEAQRARQCARRVCSLGAAGVLRVCSRGAGALRVCRRASRGSLKGRPSVIASVMCMCMDTRAWIRVRIDTRCVGLYATRPRTHAPTCTTRPSMHAYCV
jgi:hypothetical protein